MSSTRLGLLTGLALGLAIALGGFGAFAAVALLGAIGFLAGRCLDGKLDLSRLSTRDRSRP
ncbi:hypothetical protein [Amycolatopsis australiensis]|uniref:Small integral membrane protein n=1 Tax=Amycolatopsis australiensis TaxID=546364 RepID=A0A1K1RGI4_9PSEU|nr:hypothetical protein [Amycolatopsis australiensis]SFW70899.1 hypothetical protein SAMN04489730_3189 [Amycolatopsis australiensis]